MCSDECNLLYVQDWVGLLVSVWQCWLHSWAWQGVKTVTMHVDCPSSGQDIGNFCRSQERAWLTAWGVFMGNRKGVFLVREPSLSACSLYYWRCYCSFPYSIAASSKLFLSEPMIFTYCASKFSSPACHREGGARENGTLNWGIPFLNHIINVQMLMDFGHQDFQISFPFSYSCYVCCCLHLISQWQQTRIRSIHLQWKECLLL